MSGERVDGLRGSEITAGSPGAPGEGRAGPIDLRLVALTTERGHLVLEDGAAQQYRVPVDERLAAALRAAAPRTRARTGQLEIALESQLTPREIQSRIRAGHSLEEVARAAGIATERVERYAAPVIAERAHVLEQAQQAGGRRASAGSAPPLLTLVAARLAEQRASAESTEWDAWRADDEERWTVQLAYLAGDRARTATWTFDPRGRVLSPADDEARWLVQEGPGGRVEDVPAVVRRLSSVPVEDGDAAAGAARTDEVYDREADEARAAARAEQRGQGQDPAAPPSAQPAAAAAGRHGRRPSVPAFDDIMFGPRRRD